VTKTYPTKDKDCYKESTSAMKLERMPN